jgi:DNA-binding NtrC family response regulator
MKKAKSILLVEDEHALGNALCQVVRRIGHVPTLAASGASAVDAFAGEKFDAVVLDIGLPDRSGLEILEEVRGLHADLPVLVITAHATLDHAIRARQLGATGYLTKPLDLGHFGRALAALLAEGPEVAGQVADDERERPTLIGEAPRLQEVFVGIACACSSGVPTLISGPPGSGKSLAASIIHSEGPGSEGPLVKAGGSRFESGEVLDGWLDGEEAAEAGAILIDAPEEMAGEAQKRLAERLGSWTAGQQTGRLVLAVARDDPKRLVPDLFHVFSASLIEMPPLSERSGDIPALGAHFLGQHEGEHRITAPALAALQNYEWPGNVRELRAALEFAVSLSHGSELYLSHLPRHVAAAAPDASQPALTSELGSVIERWIDWQLQAGQEEGPGYDGMLDNIEAVMLKHLLVRFDGKVTRLAAGMGMNRATLRQKLRRLGLAGESPED